MKWTGLVALAAVALLPAGIAAAAPASREAVRAALRAHEQSRMSADDWRGLGEDVDAQLIEAASDERLLFGARQRAMTALGSIGGPRAKAFLYGILTAPNAPAPLLSSAVQAYARGFGTAEPVEAQRLAVTVLGHPDWQARRGAARAMAVIGGPAARAALRERESRETHPAVRSAIESALRETPAVR
jgi:hypothetical protein